MPEWLILQAVELEKTSTTHHPRNGVHSVGNHTCIHMHTYTHTHTYTCTHHTHTHTDIFSRNTAKTSFTGMLQKCLVLEQLMSIIHWRLNNLVSAEMRTVSGFKAELVRTIETLGERYIVSCF